MTDAPEVAETDGDLVPVIVIHDPALGSPPELSSWANKSISVPATRIPLPVRGRLFGLRGYSRQTSVQVQGPSGPENAMRWEWVLQGDTDPVDTFVDSLTGRGGWLVPQARAAVKLMVARMFSAGIPRATIVAQVPQFYAAVAAEVRAGDALPPDGA